MPNYLDWLLASGQKVRAKIPFQEIDHNRLANVASLAHLVHSRLGMLSKHSVYGHGTQSASALFSLLRDQATVNPFYVYGTDANGSKRWRIFTEGPDWTMLWSAYLDAPYILDGISGWFTDYRRATFYQQVRSLRTSGSLRVQLMDLSRSMRFIEDFTVGYNYKAMWFTNVTAGTGTNNRFVPALTAGGDAFGVLCIYSAKGGGSYRLITRTDYMAIGAPYGIYNMTMRVRFPQQHNTSIKGAITVGFFDTQDPDTSTWEGIAFVCRHVCNRATRMFIKVRNHARSKSVIKQIGIYPEASVWYNFRVMICASHKKAKFYLNDSLVATCDRYIYSATPAMRMAGLSCGISNVTKTGASSAASLPVYIDYYGFSAFFKNKRPS